MHFLDHCYRRRGCAFFICMFSADFLFVGFSFTLLSLLSPVVTVDPVVTLDPCCHC